jgi:predicted kinase
MELRRPDWPIRFEAQVSDSDGGSSSGRDRRFPWRGQSQVAERLSRELSLPLLNSDVAGGTIRDLLAGKIESSDAFRAGYEVLFTLAETFLGSGCSAVVDMSMGWEFQWQRLDALAGKLPEVSFLPIILRCPRHIAVERITRRHEDSGGTRSTAAQILAGHPHVWDYLEQLDRPDVRFVDAAHGAELVYAQTVKHIQEFARHGPDPRRVRGSWG